MTGTEQKAACRPCRLVPAAFPPGSGLSHLFSPSILTSVFSALSLSFPVWLLCCVSHVFFSFIAIFPFVGGCSIHLGGLVFGADAYPGRWVEGVEEGWCSQTSLSSVLGPERRLCAMTSRTCHGSRVIKVSWGLWACMHAVHVFAHLHISGRSRWSLKGGGMQPVGMVQQVCHFGEIHFCRAQLGKS